MHTKEINELIDKLVKTHGEGILDEVLEFAEAVTSRDYDKFLTMTKAKCGDAALIEVMELLNIPKSDYPELLNTPSA